MGDDEATFGIGGAGDGKKIGQVPARKADKARVRRRGPQLEAAGVGRC